MTRGEDIVNEKEALFMLPGVVDAMDDDGVDVGIFEEVFNGCFLEDAAIKISMSVDDLFGE